MVVRLLLLKCSMFSILDGLMPAVCTTGRSYPNVSCTTCSVLFLYINYQAKTDREKEKERERLSDKRVETETK